MRVILPCGTLYARLAFIRLAGRASASREPERSTERPQSAIRSRRHTHVVTPARPWLLLFSKSVQRRLPAAPCTPACTPVAVPGGGRRLREVKRNPRDLVFSCVTTYYAHNHSSLQTSGRLESSPPPENDENENPRGKKQNAEKQNTEKAHLNQRTMSKENDRAVRLAPSREPRAS